ncbi:hypothetical protein JZU71_01540, partial [bacterium]|nr:hypothetical protein [bacterium]
MAYSLVQIINSIMTEENNYSLPSRLITGKAVFYRVELLLWKIINGDEIDGHEDFACFGIVIL